MRAFLLVLSFLPFAVGQGGPQPLTDAFPIELQSFFGLSDEQVRQVVATNENYLTAAGVQAARIQQLQQQIDAETHKPVLDVLALGTLYVALEQARRAQEAARTQAVNAILALLSPSQRLRLQTLQDALSFQALIQLAAKQNFLVIPGAPGPLPQAKLPDLLPASPGQPK